MSSNGALGPRHHRGRRDCALGVGRPRREPRPLTAIVGANDAFTITLNDASGQKVARLLPGTYTVVVDDRSRIHNFHLASNDDPTVDFRTDVDFVGQKSFTVTFKNDNRYAYACEPHWQTMNGSFLVTDAPPPRLLRLLLPRRASGR